MIFLFTRVQKIGADKTTHANLVFLIEFITVADPRTVPALHPF